MLGVSRNHAQALLSRACEQLETCLAVLLVGRAGRGECDELATLLAGWDGRLTILLRKRVHRHIEQCATCGDRRAQELRPAMLLDLSPGAALAAGAAASLRLAGGAPDGLRAHTITLATGQGVGAVAHRAAVLSRAGAFTRSGFPKPAHGATGGLAARGDAGAEAAGGAGAGGPGGVRGVRGTLRSSPRGVAAVTAAIVIAAIIAVVAFALTGNSRTASPAADPSTPGVAAAAAATSAAAAAPGASAAARKTGPPAGTPAATSVGPTAATGPAAAPTPSTAARRPARRDTRHYQPDGAGQRARARRAGGAPCGRPARAGAERAGQADRPQRERQRRLARHLVDGRGQRPGRRHQRVVFGRNPDAGRPDGHGHHHRESFRALRRAAVSDDHGQPRRRRVLDLHRVVQEFHGAGSAQADDDAYASPPGREPAEYRAGPLRRPGTGGPHGRVL